MGLRDRENFEVGVDSPETLPPPAPPGEREGEGEELRVLVEDKVKREGVALGECIEVGDKEEEAEEQ